MPVHFLGIAPALGVALAAVAAAAVAVAPGGHTMLDFMVFGTKRPSILEAMVAKKRCRPDRVPRVMSTHE